MQEIETLNYFTETDTEQAFLLAQQKQLPVLVDFWAPGCKGCKKMELTTYQSPSIQSYIDTNFVFIKYDITSRYIPKIQSTPILWTPTFIVFANDRSEIRKITGYLSDQQFKAEMELGRALSFLRKSQARKSLEILESYISNIDNQILKPEILYWAGVATYFSNGRNAKNLVPYWNELLWDYPESVWAKRADILNVAV